MIPFFIVFLGTLRLSRFVDKRSNKSEYRGLPTPCLALLVIHISYLFGWGSTDLFLPYFSLLVIGVVGVLLYAPISYPKIREKVFLIGGGLFLIIIFIGLLLSNLSNRIGMIVLIFTTCVLLGYVFISPLIVKLYAKKGR